MLLPSSCIVLQCCSIFVSWLSQHYKPWQYAAFCPIVSILNFFHFLVLVLTTYSPWLPHSCLQWQQRPLQPETNKLRTSGGTLTKNKGINGQPSPTFKHIFCWYWYLVLADVHSVHVHVTCHFTFTHGPSDFQAFTGAERRQLR